MFFPDPNFSIPDPGSQIQGHKDFRIPDPDPHQRIEVFFPQKKLFLSSRNYDPGCSSRILDPDLDFLSIPDPGVKKTPDPGSGSATLILIRVQYKPYYSLPYVGGEGGRNMLVSHQPIGLFRGFEWCWVGMIRSRWPWPKADRPVQSPRARSLCVHYIFSRFLKYSNNSDDWIRLKKITPPLHFLHHSYQRPA